MDLENIMLSEVSHTERDKILYDTTYMWNPKGNTSESLQNRIRLTDLENKHGYHRGDRVRERQISMGLMDTIYIHKIDKTTRICCIAQGIIFNRL